MKCDLKCDNLNIQRTPLERQRSDESQPGDLDLDSTLDNITMRELLKSLNEIISKSIYN